MTGRWLSMTLRRTTAALALAVVGGKDDQHEQKKDQLSGEWCCWIGSRRN
jgi:hypothetical protein